MEQKREFLVDILHIFILFCFAFAQPLFDLLSRNAEFFVARHSKPVDVILLVLILCVLLPALLVLVEVVAALFGRRTRKGVHYFLMTVLIAVIALPAMKKIFEIPGTALIAGVAILGVTVTLAYIRFHPVRMFLTFLSPALLLFPGLFLFNSPIFKVVFPQKDPFVFKVKVNNPPPIIMLVFDEFPITSLMDEHGQIDPVLYPNFAALARDAYWFRNTTTTAAQTTLAVPAILTGNYPDPARQPTAADYPRNIFTLLGGVYDLEVFESVTHLCPTQLCGEGVRILLEEMNFLLSDLSVVYLHIIFPSDMTAGLPAIMYDWKDFIKDKAVPEEVKNNKTQKKKSLRKRARKRLRGNRLSKFSQFIDSIDSVREPALHFMYINLPHRLWEYLPSGRKYRVLSKDNTWDFLPHGEKSNASKIMGTGIGPKGEIWGDDEWIVTQAYQLHLLQVGLVDKLFGQLMEKLKAVGIYNRSLIIVTADHGISFRPNDYLRVVSESNSGDIMSVPLFIKAPNQQEGVISDRKVETIDILPTITDILGIKIPWELDGHSALDKSLTEREETLFYNPGNEKLKFMQGSILDVKRDTLEWKLTVFGSRTKSDGLFKIGPFNHLVGRSIKTIDVVEGNVRVELDRAILYANLDTKAAVVPSHISGRAFLNGNTGAKLNLAISINGTIRAVTQTFPLEKGVAEWSAMVPETAFQPGKNKVEAFLVSQIAGQPPLERIKSRSDITYFLSASSGLSSEIITTSDGKSISVIPGALKGFVKAKKRDGLIRVSGWAADVKNSRFPDAIVIFVNGKFLYSGSIEIDRPDVAKLFNNDALLTTGFKFVFPFSLFKDKASSEVRIFAVSHDVASELSHHKKYKW